MESLWSQKSPKILQCSVYVYVYIQAVWGCEQPGVEGFVPAYSRGFELRDLHDPFQPKPLYDSVNSRDKPLKSTSSTRINKLFAS